MRLVLPLKSFNFHTLESRYPQSNPLRSEFCSSCRAYGTVDGQTISGRGIGDDDKRSNLQGSVPAEYTGNAANNHHSQFSCLRAPLAYTQTELQLPTFPTAGLTSQLPVADDIAFPFPSKGYAKTPAMPSAGTKAIGLLGLNKNGVHPVIMQSVVDGKLAESKATVPSFPLTIAANEAAPTEAVHAPASKPQPNTDSHRPNICLSSGKFESKIVLASASSTNNVEGLPKQVENESVELAIVEQTTSDESPSGAAALDSSDSLTESLIDIEIPPLEAIPAVAQTTASRQPEIVNREQLCNCILVRQIGRIRQLLKWQPGHNGQARQIISRVWLFKILQLQAV